MSFIHSLRRGGVVVGATTALAIAMAGPAAAHHCYKEAWNEAARAQLESGKTRWMPMTEYVAGAMQFQFELPPVCVAHAGEFVEDWMEHANVDDEPLINMGGTAGGGAYHRKGFEPKPFSYLTDADFGYLESLIGAEPDCQPEPEES